MILRVMLLLTIIVQVKSYGQRDSIWNVMVLKKGLQPEIKDNMALYSPTGFYLYRNCFYDLKLKDNTKKTLRLIDVKPDTLIFIGVSNKRDTNWTRTAKDTLFINYTSIDKILLVKDWSSGASKKIKCKDYYFLFYKTLTNNKYDSKYGYVFSANERHELVPRLSSYGITYHYEYGGKLYYHSGIEVQVPRYSNEEKVMALNAAIHVLDFILNKRVNVTIQHSGR